MPQGFKRNDASLEGLQWTVNAYTLTFAVLLLTGATLGERYGRRRLFTIVAALSLLLCLATVVLWVRSYWVGDSWFVYDPSAGEEHRLSSARGVVSFARSTAGTVDRLPTVCREPASTAFMLSGSPGC